MESDVKAIVTTSWDDGCPDDVRLAELLRKYAINGTFYVPATNVEGKPVLTAREIRDIGAEFEIGGHTLDHIFLDSIDDRTAERQIVEGRTYLDDILGRKTKGFCYLGGKYNKTIEQIVRKAGFEYARTTKNLAIDVKPSEIMEMPTSIQFYPRAGFKHVKSYLEFGHYLERWRYFTAAFQNGGLAERMKRLIDVCRTQNGYFHMCGHSCEISEFGLWDELEEVLAYISDLFEPDELVDNYCAMLRLCRGSVSTITE